MRTVAWLVRRDLLTRKGSTVLAGLLVATAVALCASLEQAAAQRDAAAAAEVDLMGAPLRLVPRGVTGLDLIRSSPAGKTLDADLAARIIQAHGTLVRQASPRLLASVNVAGSLRPVAGLDPERLVSAFSVLSTLGRGQVVAGHSVARKLGVSVGGTLSMGGKRLRVDGVLSAAGTSDDNTLFVGLQELQTLVGKPGQASEIAIYLRPGVDQRRVAGLLSAEYPRQDMLRSDRGKVADRDLAGALGRNRRAVYLSVAAVVAVCLLLLSVLDTAERRMEMATLVALGATAKTVLGFLAFRASVIAAGGALAGLTAVTLLGALMSGGVDPPATWSVLLALMGGAIVTAVIGTLPSAAQVAFQQHATTLQS